MSYIIRKITIPFGKHHFFPPMAMVAVLCFVPMLMGPMVLVCGPASYGTYAEITTEVEFVGEKLPNSISTQATNYFITAVSDSKTTISPEGVISIPAGESQIFYFSADGGGLFRLIVDGLYIPQAQIETGSYSFVTVYANHTIQILASDPMTDITLSISVMEGKGYAEYSINGGPFYKYQSQTYGFTIPIFPEHSDVVVIAYGENSSLATGYTFKEGMVGGKKYISSKINLSNLTTNTHLELFFSKNSVDIGNVPTKSDDTSLWLVIGATIVVIVSICIATAIILREIKKRR